MTAPSRYQTTEVRYREGEQAREVKLATAYFDAAQRAARVRPRVEWADLDSTTQGSFRAMARVALRNVTAKPLRGRR